MYSDIVPVAALAARGLDVGQNYTVGVLSKPVGLASTRMGQLCGMFQGVNALLDYQAAKQPEARKYMASNRTRDVSGTFHTFDSYAEAVDVYRHRPHTITEFAELDAYIGGGESGGRELAYDVQGDFLDVGRYLDGEPECVGRLVDGNPLAKRVHFVVALSAVSNVKNTVVMARSGRLVALIDWLEAQGVRCQVTGIVSHESTYLEVIAKHFDEPLQVTDLSVMAHPDFLRRVVFRFCEYSQTCPSGYGRARAFAKAFRVDQHASEYTNEYTVFLGNNYGASIPASFDYLQAELTGMLAGELDRRTVVAMQ